MTATYRNVLSDISILADRHHYLETRIQLVEDRLEVASDLLRTMRAEILDMQRIRPGRMVDTPNDQAIDKFLEGR